MYISPSIQERILNKHVTHPEAIDEMVRKMDLTKIQKKKKKMILNLVNILLHLKVTQAHARKMLLGYEPNCN